MRERVRALGVPLGAYPPGPENAITDVAGVRVGHTTLISGDGRLEPGRGPVRTGVTAIHPGAGDVFVDRPAAGAHVLNGAGEVAGLAQVREWGCLESPIVLTNTFGVPAATEALVDWLLERHPSIGRESDVCLPLVGECDDSWLNDIAGRHVTPRHVREALDAALAGPVPEGNVGAGTGMVTLGLKGGLGTSSRVLPEDLGGFTVGVLVQSNFGRLTDFRLAGLPIGGWLAERAGHHDARRRDYGSALCIVATDAPLVDRQLDRLALRATLGLARVGSIGAHASGEFALAFSTTTRFPRQPTERVQRIDRLHDLFIDALFRAAAECAEEAVLNALCQAETMVGANGHRVDALDLDAVRAYLAVCPPRPPLAIPSHR